MKLASKVYYKKRLGETNQTIIKTHFFPRASTCEKQYMFILKNQFFKQSYYKNSTVEKNRISKTTNCIF